LPKEEIKTPIVKDPVVVKDEPIINKEEKLIKKSIPVASDSQIKKLDTGDLAFTLDLGNFNSPKPELFEHLDGVEETFGPDKKYHYTYGNLKIIKRP